MPAARDSEFDAVGGDRPMTMPDTTSR